MDGQDDFAKTFLMNKFACLKNVLRSLFWALDFSLFKVTVLLASHILLLHLTYYCCSATYIWRGVNYSKLIVPLAVLKILLQTQHVASVHQLSCNWRSFCLRSATAPQDIPKYFCTNLMRVHKTNWSVK